MERLSKFVKKHALSSRHKRASHTWQVYKKTETSGSADDVDMLISSHHAAITENRQHVEILLKVFILFAKQGIAFKGHEETHNSSNREITPTFWSWLVLLNPVF